MYGPQGVVIYPVAWGVMATQAGWPVVSARGSLISQGRVQCRCENHLQCGLPVYWSILPGGPGTANTEMTLPYWPELSACMLPTATVNAKAALTSWTSGHDLMSITSDSGGSSVRRQWRWYGVIYALPICSNLIHWVDIYTLIIIYILM